MKKPILGILVAGMAIFGINQPGNAENLRISFATSVEPYVIVKRHRGIEMDIVVEALQYSGHTVDPTYLPLKRVHFALEQGQVDGASPVGEDGPRGCYTDSHVTYHNMAITRKDSDIDLTSIADLSEWNVLSFQNARHFLGPEFAEMANNNRGYKETAEQFKQNLALLLNRTDVVISDRYIFNWNWQDYRVKSLIKDFPALSFQPIFPQSHYRAVFRSHNICQQFNAGLKALKDSGRHAEIYRHWLPEHTASN